MFEVLASIGGGFIVGSAINMLREGVRFRPFHSKKARAEFERKYKGQIVKTVSTMGFSKKDLESGPKWYD